MSDGISDGYAMVEETREKEHKQPYALVREYLSSLQQELERPIQHRMDSIRLVVSSLVQQRDALYFLASTASVFTIQGVELQWMGRDKFRQPSKWRLVTYETDLREKVAGEVTFDSLTQALLALPRILYGGHEVPMRGVARVLSYLKTVTLCFPPDR